MYIRPSAARQGVCLLALLPLAGCISVPVFIPASADVSPTAAAESISDRQPHSILLAEAAINPETSSTESGAAGSLPAAAAGNSGPIANESPGGADDPLPDSQAVTDEDLLDGQRGGFDSGGLVMSFGIQQAAYINGQLVSSQSLNITDMSKLAAGIQGILAAGGNLSGFSIIQSGGGSTAGTTVSAPASSATGNTPAPVNTASASTATTVPNTTAGLATVTVPATAAGTILQNTLDRQTLKTLTTINVSLNSLQLLRNLNLQASIRDSVLAALRK